MQVLFSSTENGRSSFVRQLEPDWHIDTNPEIVTQLAVCFFISRHHSPSKLLITITLFVPLSYDVFLMITTNDVAEVYQVSAPRIAL